MNPTGAPSKLGSKDRRRRVQALIERDGLACCFCGKPIKPDAPANAREALSIEHVIPRSEGGPNALENLKLAHRGCNNDRGGRQGGAPTGWAESMYNFSPGELEARSARGRTGCCSGRGRCRDSAPNWLAAAGGDGPDEHRRDARPRVPSGPLRSEGGPHMNAGAWITVAIIVLALASAAWLAGPYDL